MIRLDLCDPIATISLDRPRARNALDAAGWRALADAILAAGRSPARLLLLRSSVPGAFCAGSDLAELEALATDEAARAPFRRLMRDAIDALPRIDIPTVAVIDGDCFGAGVALALGCDIRIAGPRARFAITPAKLGISYPAEDVARLVAAVGRGQAARLLFAASAIDGNEAARIGLVEEACPSAGARAAEMSEQILACSRESLALLKALLQGRTDRAESDAAFDARFGSADFAAALAAFRARPRRDGGGSPDRANAPR